MKKEEVHRESGPKESRSNRDFRSRSHSPKLYIGCHTCQVKNNELKHVKSIGKLGDFSDSFPDRNRVKKTRKNHQEKDRDSVKKSRVKLTDLCDDDKKRIVMLIEELSKLAEKNEKLKETLDRVQKTKREQQVYIMKQANLHMEEKNFYVNEINSYKSKIEAFEKELEIKTVQWQNQEKLMDTEMSCIVKALQDSLKEKSELSEEMNNLKVCLRQSLDAFQRLGAEVSELQRQENYKKISKSISCQTDLMKNDSFKSCNEESEEEEFLSTSNNNNSNNINSNNILNTKSSLYLINDKLDNMYQMLKMQGENLGNLSPQKYDIDLSILLKNVNNAKEENINSCPDFRDDDALREESDQDYADSGYKFLKPFDECSKTSIQAKRILKKMEKPLNLIVNPCSKSPAENNSKKIKIQANFEDVNNQLAPSNVLQQKIVQQNNLCKSSEQELSEDRLLEELFYSDRNLNFGLEAILELNNKEALKI